MKYHFKIHKEKNSYWAECIELLGCRTQGNSIKELGLNMHECLNLFLEEPKDSKTSFPLPKKGLKGRNIVMVSVDANVAFAFLLRQIRLKHHMTQKEAARIVLGSNRVYSYQRLESSKTANPELKTLVMIKKIFPEFDLEQILCT